MCFVSHWRWLEPSSDFIVFPDSFCLNSCDWRTQGLDPSWLPWFWVAALGSCQWPAIWCSMACCGQSVTRGATRKSGRRRVRGDESVIEPAGQPMSVAGEDSAVGCLQRQAPRSTELFFRDARRKSRR